MRKLYKGLPLIIFLFVISGDLAFSADLQCQSMPALMSVYLKNHFSINEITPALQDRTVIEFIRRLDPDKERLYKKDVEQLKSDVAKLFKSSKDGDCSSLETTSALLISRAEENLKIVNEKLSAGLKVDPNTKFQSDATKRDYPVDVNAKAQALSTITQFRLASFALRMIQNEQAKKKVIEYYENALKEAKDLDKSKLVGVFAEAFAFAMDGHSAYLPPQKLEDFKNHINPFPEKAEIIEKVNPKALSETITIVYQTVQSAKRSFKVGVIQFPAFYGDSSGKRNSFEDLKKIIEEANSNKVDGLVIDLSLNGGGLLKAATQIANIFVGPVPVLTSENKDKKNTVTSYPEKAIYTKPLIFVTSRSSSSASEILAGAMQDYHRAIVVGGDHTFGSGTIQVLNVLPLGLGAMKLTTEMWFLPNGNSTQLNGIVPDIVVPTALDARKTGEQYFDAALPNSKIAPFVALPEKTTETWKSVTKEQIALLKDKSLKRIKVNQDFKEVQTYVSELNKKQGWVSVSEVLHPNKANTDIFEKSRNANVQEAVNIMQDWLSN